MKNQLKLSLDNLEAHPLLRICYLADFLVADLDEKDINRQEIETTVQTLYGQLRKQGMDKHLEYDKEFDAYFPNEAFEEWMQKYILKLDEDEDA